MLDCVWMLNTENWVEYWKIYLIPLKIFMLIINQRNNFFVWIFMKKVNTSQSQIHIAHIQALIHIHTYIDPNKSPTELILSLGFFVFFSKNIWFRSFITFLCVTLVIWSDVIPCRKVFVDCDVICHTCLLNNVCLFIVIKLIFTQRQLFILNQ